MRTATLFPKLTETCQVGLDAMPIIENEITKIQKEKDVTFSPSEAFTLAYFRRNKLYLQSAFIVGSMGFFGPSINLQRTVYETILRGYLFIVDMDEAKNYYDKLDTKEIDDFLKKRKYYGHAFLCEKLFNEKRKKQQRRFYGRISESAHAEIKGLFQDFPKYNEKGIKDSLKTLLMLSYGNVQMVSELFLESYNPPLKTLVATFMGEISTSLNNQIPLFEPNKEQYEGKIKFKKGNFIDALK